MSRAIRAWCHSLIKASSKPACAVAGVHSVIQKDSGKKLRDAFQVADAEQQDQHHWSRRAECASHVAGVQPPSGFWSPVVSFFAVVFQRRSAVMAPAAVRLRPIMCMRVLRR